MWYYIYHYFLAIHPVYWLYQKALLYSPENMAEGVWLALAVFGIAAWFGLTRFLAETPGRKHGNTIFWWIIISVFHIWSIPTYIIYDLAAGKARHRWQSTMQKKYADRTPSEIWSGSSEKRPPRPPRARR